MLRWSCRLDSVDLQFRLARRTKGLLPNPEYPDVIHALSVSTKATSTSDEAETAWLEVYQSLVEALGSETTLPSQTWLDMTRHLL